MNHPLLPSVSVVSLSLSVGWGAYLTFFYKNNRPIIFQTISESERNSDSLDIISNLPELPGFTQEPVGLFDVLKCVLWTMGYVSEKLGVWCFLRTALLGALRTAVISESSLLQVLMPTQE
jgi:hypothetical protein